MTSTLDGQRSNGRAHTGAEQLLDRLNEPRTLEALNRLLDHAELLAFSAASLDGLVRRSDVIVENVAAGVAELRESFPDGPAVDGAELGRLVAQLPRLVELTTQLTALTERPELQSLLALASTPGTIDALSRLLKHADLIAYMVDALDALLQRSDTMVESVRAILHEVASSTPGASDSLITLLDTLHRQRDYVPRLIAVVPQFTDIVERISPFVASEEFHALLSSGIFHPDTVTLLGQAGDSFVETYDEHQRTGRKLGPVGILRALNDPDVQRVAALLVAFSRRFGETLNRPSVR
jgi:uncharacterized protein YjgD (DUF1641 family)